MTSQFDHVQIVSHEMVDDAGLDRSRRYRSVYGALGRVWLLAAVIFLASGLFFFLMTGIVKMLLPLAFLASGLGLIGSVQVIAKIDIARRTDD